MKKTPYRMDIGRKKKIQCFRCHRLKGKFFFLVVLDKS